MGFHSIPRIINGRLRKGMTGETRHLHPNLPNRETIPAARIEARRRLEDLRLAREVGVTLEEIL